MNLQVRKPAENEIGAIVAMMRSFAEYENLSEYCTVDENILAKAIFGENSFVESLIAVEGDSPAGYAIFFPHFSSFRGQSGLYLEDIYVDEVHRGKGVGEAMLKAIARTGMSRGYERIDFQVLEWNASAIKFYEKLGAVRNDSERHFKFGDEAFEQLCQ